MVIGIAGDFRREEPTNMNVDNVEDRATVMVIDVYL